MLLIISAKVAHSLWRYFSFSAEYTAVSPSANKPPRADAKTFDKNDVQLISQQNWFGKYQPVATPVKQPEPVPVAETRLNVVLRGIAFGARPGAVIEEGGKQQVYLQGETLGSHNAVIEEINRDHVMLRYQGKIGGNCRLCSEAGGRSFSVRCQRFQGRRYRHCAKSAGFH